MKLELKNLSVSYDKKIIKNINLIVEEGEFLTILGESGSGKSTILKSITGLINIDTGSILVNNEDVTNISTNKREIGYVFQKPLLFPHLNVIQNIKFSMEIKNWNKEKIKSRTNELISMLFLEELEGRMPHELSGGQQQRVSIARTLATYPKVLLMDEPFSSLDPRLRDELGVLIKTIQKKMNLTIIFVTHDVDEAMKLSNKIALINEGKIVQIGSSNYLYNKPVNKLVGEFFGKSNWIYGNIEKGEFKSEIIKFKIIDLEDGLAVVHIRPHKIKIINSIGNYIIKSIQNLGRDKKVIIGYNNLELLVETQDEIIFKIGQMVSIEINSANLHVLRSYDGGRF